MQNYTDSDTQKSNLNAQCTRVKGMPIDTEQ